MVNPDRNLYEPPYDDALLYDSDLEPERPRSRPLVVLLGIVVLAAFAGVVWVAYNQGVKQGQNGSPPVLTADSGPTRIVPDQSATSPTMNPAPDKSYERLWGETSDREGQENVLPQPEQPRSVPAPQDVASDATASARPEGSAGGPLESKASDVPPPAEDPRMDSTVGSVSSLAENTGAPRPITSTPLSSSGTPAMFGSKPQSEDITSALPPVESASPPATAPRSLTPTPPKPAATKPVTVIQTAPAAGIAKPTTAGTSVSERSAAAGPKVLTADPSALQTAAPPASSEKRIAALTPPSETTAAPPPPAASDGSVMIQLGSFPNDALAASAWSKIKSSNQELLGSYSPSIKPAEIPGKGTWYRLRVGGFTDKASARGVCDQLASNGQACIIASK